MSEASRTELAEEVTPAVAGEKAQRVPGPNAEHEIGEAVHIDVHSTRHDGRARCRVGVCYEPPSETVPDDHGDLVRGVFGDDEVDSAIVVDIGCSEDEGIRGEVDLRPSRPTGQERRPGPKNFEHVVRDLCRRDVDVAVMVEVPELESGAYAAEGNSRNVKKIASIVALKNLDRVVHDHGEVQHAVRVEIRRSSNGGKEAKHNRKCSAR